MGTRSGGSGSEEIFKLNDVSDQVGGMKLWTLTFDLPGEKVNKLSRKVMERFEALLPSLEAMASDGRIEALALVSGKPGNFIAGADIEMIQSARTAEEAQS